MINPHAAINAQAAINPHAVISPHAMPRRNVAALIFCAWAPCLALPSQCCPTRCTLRGGGAAANKDAAAHLKAMLAETGDKQEAAVIRWGVGGQHDINIKFRVCVCLVIPVAELHIVLIPFDGHCKHVTQRAPSSAVCMCVNTHCHHSKKA